MMERTRLAFTIEKTEVNQDESEDRANIGNRTGMGECGVCGFGHVLRRSVQEPPPVNGPETNLYLG